MGYIVDGKICNLNRFMISVKRLTFSEKSLLVEDAHRVED